MTSSREIEACDGACAFEIMIAIPSLIFYSILGFGILVCLCCLPCICANLCCPNGCRSTATNTKDDDTTVNFVGTVVDVEMNIVESAEE